MRLTQQQRTVENVELFRTKFMNLHMAAVPIMVCRTREPMRLQDCLREFAFAEDGMAFRAWNIVHGWMTYDKTNPNRVPDVDGTVDPFGAMRMISGGDRPRGGSSDGSAWGDGIYTMMYPHMVNLNKNPSMIQCIKEYALSFAENHKRLVMIVPPDYELPIELEDDVAMIDFEVPSYAELATQVDQVLGGIPQEKVPMFGNADRDRVVSIGIGMTMTEFDNALSRALVEGRSELPDLSIDAVAEVLAACKVETIKKTDVLELVPAEDATNLGGLENLKEWLQVRVASFSEEAEAFGISPPRGITLVGPPGCISGDAVVAYRRGKRNSSRTLTLKTFHDKFNGIGDHACPPWAEGIDTFLHSYDVSTGRVFYNLVKGVYYKGVRPVVEIHVDGAGSVRLTPDHPVLTADGTFTPAGDVKYGDKLLVRGTMLTNPNEYETSTVKRKRVVIEGLKYHPTAWGKSVTDKTSGKMYNYLRTHKARLVVEAHMNKISYDEFVKILKEEPEVAETLAFIPKEYDVHHIDEDPANDSVDNLQVMLRGEHTLLHSGGQDRFNVDYTRIMSVSGVNHELASEPVYDVSMEEPCANFAVGEGILVHNTGKSLAAKVTADVLGLPLIRFDVSRIFQSLVGSSEARVRSTLKLVDAMAPCVLLIDEIDKAFGGTVAGLQGDSGVGQRVLGAILTWLQESTAPVFCVTTANRSEYLPPELMRRGRMDEVFSVQMPSEDERREIFTIHLDKRGHDHGNIDDLELAIDASSGFVGAEIEAAVKDALIESFSENDGVLTGQVIANQFGHMKPLSVAFAEQFAAMAEWAHNNARPANAGEPPTPIRTRTRSEQPVTDPMGRGTSHRHLDLDG